MSQVISFLDYTPAARFDDVAWETVEVEEGATFDGPWTLIDTLTLDPADADPENPQSRDLTTSSASDGLGLWYRLTFKDGIGNSGQPSRPVQNLGAEAALFATRNDFATRLGITLVDDEPDRIDALLAQASRLIQDATRQTIALVEDDELVRPGSYSDRIRLPQRPVVEVASITAALLGGDPVDIPDTSWYLDGDELVRVNLLGIISERFFGFSGRGWLAPTFTLTITYTHGYETVPDIAKSVCLEAVTRVWTNPGVVREEAYGSSQITYQKSSGLLLTDDEHRQLNDVFRRTSGSVALR